MDLKVKEERIRKSEYGDRKQKTQKGINTKENIGFKVIIHDKNDELLKKEKRRKNLDERRENDGGRNKRGCFETWVSLDWNLEQIGF